MHWAPDPDVVGSTSVKQGTDEKFQDWNMSGGSSQSQPWGREKATQPCAVNLPAAAPQALSASMPIPLQWLLLLYLALNHPWSCWGSMKVDKKGLQKMFCEKMCQCVVIQQPAHSRCLLSMAGLGLLTPAEPIPHSRQHRQAAEQSDTPRLNRFVISYIWRVRKTTNKHCVMIPSGKL